MGMYTELHYNVELKQDVPDHVIGMLYHMLGKGDADLDECSPAFDHELFSTNRYRFMLRCDSYYFAADTHCTLRFDTISDSHYLCIRTNLKNYGNEIEKFLDWIGPYVDAYDGEFLGFYRYEEYDTPTLVFQGKVVELNDDCLKHGRLIKGDF